MARIWFEAGTRWCPCPQLARAYRRIAAAYRDRNRDLFIMSGNDSDHDMASMHYIDQAMDFAINGVGSEQVRAAANDVGPEDEIAKVYSYFDVVVYAEKGIYHVEYDPKK